MHRPTLARSVPATAAGRQAYVEALLAFHGSVFGDARMDGGDDDPEEDDDPDDPDDDDPGDDDASDEDKKRGYPLRTATKDMKPSEQAAYFKAQMRKKDAYIKKLDVKELQRKAGEYDALDKESKSGKDKDTDKAIETARAEARAEADKAAEARVAAKLVKAEFKAAAGKDVDRDTLDEYLEDVDLTRFLDEDGEVDEEKVARRVALLARQTDGDPDDDGAKSKRRQDLGQGRRRNRTTRKGEAGAAEAARRFDKAKSST